jgi:hypothetical protein
MKLSKFRKTRKIRKNIKQKGGSHFDEQRLLQFLDNLNKEIWENKYVLDNNIKKINGCIDEIHSIKNKLDTIPNEKIQQFLNGPREILTHEEFSKKVKEQLFNQNKKARTLEDEIDYLRENLEQLFFEIDNEIADMLSPEPDNNLTEYIQNSVIYQEQIDNIYKMLGIYNLRPEVLFK